MHHRTQPVYYIPCTTPNMAYTRYHIPRFTYNITYIPHITHHVAYKYTTFHIPYTIYYIPNSLTIQEQ